MDRSVEKQVSRALRRLTFWRIVGEFVGFPSTFFAAIAACFTSIHTLVSNLELAVFSLELEQARRYRTLTGIDLGVAGKQPGRYVFMDAARSEAVLRQTLAEES
jgi:hypothetical protein